jgi:low temperature requirement protein LtrA
MWWSYFARSKQELEHALESSEGTARSLLARDAYSIIHFPMLLGVIAFAAAVEHALAHPADPMTVEWRALLAASVLLFVGGMAVALTRGGRPVPLVRRLLTPITAAAVMLLADVPAVVSLATVLIGLTLLAIGEPVRVHAQAAGSSDAQ